MLSRQTLRLTPLRSIRFQQFSSSEADQNISSWMKKLSTKVTKSEGKEKYGQLNALINFYNKNPVQSEDSEIDWASWESKVQTDGLVSNLKDKFEKLQSQDYKNEDLVQYVSDTSSDAYLNMNDELQFHNELWYNYHIRNKICENDTNDIGNLNDLTGAEIDASLGSVNMVVEKLYETNNYLPGSHDDVNYYGYLYTTFSWGRKQISFYRNPLDDYRSVKASKNIMGQ